jgi:hypothetical protein
MLWTLKNDPFFKTFFGFSFLDIYKCPEFISLFTFGKIFVTDTYYIKNSNNFVTIFGKEIKVHCFWVYFLII